MPQKIGPMRQRISLLAPISEIDSLGEDLPDWQPVATIWASVQDPRSDELVYADQTIGQRRLRVVIRWRPGVTAQMKVGYDGQEFNIESVRDPDQRRRFLELDCIGEA